ncbi:hypothetical protein DFR70_102544 [Nocardia tenerifensis]|uniref:Uncharacterized protein n=1 Tax=Nocardia tenerifensis TaxID=228006 RepID=A0A318K677_9NOCA|nr:hypothetical protein [Nocardia tenerifensis]PXX68858.1 hypothetical protein DFR70_102544 [Nocardia tenerifensis]
MSIRFIGGYVALVAILLFVWASYPDRNPLFAAAVIFALIAMIAMNIWIHLSARRQRDKRKAPRPERDKAPSTK